jgi:hypothetical protein
LIEKKNKLKHLRTKIIQRSYLRKIRGASCYFAVISLQCLLEVILRYYNEYSCGINIVYVFEILKFFNSFPSDINSNGSYLTRNRENITFTRTASEKLTRFMF